MKQQDRMRVLAGSALFAGCSKKQLKVIASLCRVTLVEKGAVLITAGAPSSEAFVITAGTAEVKRKGGRPATLGPGDVVGELGLLLDRPRNATVVATSSLEVLALSRPDLRTAVEHSPELGWTLLEAVAARLEG